MRKIKVPQKYNGKKLSNFILDTFKNLNPNVLYKALRKKDIRINNVKVSENTTIFFDDEITIYITDDLLFGTNLTKLHIIYEDENILVINKPEGIAVTDNASTDITLTQIVQNQFGKNVNPCHRLDLNTKGLVIFAKNSEALDILLQKFKNQEIEKHYKALVYGIPKKEHQILKAYLFKDSKKSLVYISDEPKKDYIEIITEYTILETDLKKNTSLLDINLHTGRTHQIRAHLAHIGFPIIGDGKYGINNINKTFNKKTQELISYKIIFKFTSNSEILHYLNGKEISL